MDEKKAREILGDTIEADGSLHDLHSYVDWRPGENDVTIDCQISAEELEAIAWWMKNKGKKGE